MSPDPRKPEALGHGLALPAGDLELRSGENGLDFARVAGIAALHQGLETLLGTPFSTDIFNVTYGLDLTQPLTEPIGPVLQRELLRLQLVKAISRDDRIAEIREVVFDDDPRYFELVPSADPDEARRVHRTERRWQVVLRLALVAGGETTLRVTTPRT